MRPLSPFAVAISISTLVLASAGPVMAEGVGNPVILTPKDGGSYSYGFTGPVRIDFSNAPKSQYQVKVNCEWWSVSDSSYSYLNETYTYDGAPHVVEWKTETIEEDATCAVNVYNNVISSDGTGNESDLNIFTVRAPTLSAVRITPRRFYPIKRDGFLDSTRMKFTLARAARVSTAIRSSAGTSVRKQDLGKRRAGDRSWSWDGTRADGRTVRPGTYTVRLSATDAAGNIQRVSRRVKVSSGWIDRKVSKVKFGSAGVTATSGACSVTRPDDYRADLVCDGGRRARLTHRFTMPRNAHDVEWSVNGSKLTEDLCCYGKITKRGWRPDRRHYRVRVQVTNWRAYQVFYTLLTYKYRYLA